MALGGVGCTSIMVRGGCGLPADRGQLQELPGRGAMGEVWRAGIRPGPRALGGGPGLHGQRPGKDGRGKDEGWHSDD